MSDNTYKFIQTEEVVYRDKTRKETITSPVVINRDYVVTVVPTKFPHPERNEVEAQGCESYDDCPKGKHLLPEAHALLKYNAQYLADNLK